MRPIPSPWRILSRNRISRSCAPPDTRYLQRHPTPQDIYWLVEVADSTLNYDLTTKRQLYARAGIPEYWVVDMAGRRLQVFRDPQQGDFQSQKTLTSGVVSPLTFPDLTIEVAAVVGLP
ncbi:MAG: Uma2 family endonuclease [Prochlorothrix sp.]